MSDKPVTMSSSDFNLEKLTTPELSEHIAATINMGGNIAIFGRRGTGKTEIARQQIKRAELKEVYLNLSVLEKTDMAGFPKLMDVDPKRKFVEYLLPAYFQPLTESKGLPVVCLLDEMDKCSPDLWAPMLEFTQFRTINSIPLPNLKAIIMTGNLISEGGQKPSPPLLDRTERYLCEADATSWLNWAGAGGHIHPSITAYINDHPKDLFGAVEQDDRYSDASPRSWHRASNILWAGEERGWSSNLLNKKVCGCVGKDVGIKYSNYYEHYQQLLPMIEDIYQGKDVNAKYQPLEPTKKLVACMIACARLATQLDQADEKNPPKSIEYMGKFLQKVSFENVLVSVRSQIQIDRLVKYSLDESPFWQDTLSKINKSVDAA